MESGWLRYSLHARLQMADREITEQDVESVMADPDAITPSHATGGATVIYVGDAPDGRGLEVVVDEPTRRTVVTTYWGTHELG